MNANLTKYLSDVFRNEVQRNAAIELKEGNLKASPDLLDRNMKQFVVDKRFSLRLDELV
jgi:hypothetical protein